MRQHIPIALILALSVSGCSVLDRFRAPRAPLPAAPTAGSGLATEFAPAVETSVLGATGQSAAALDTTTTAEKQAALAAPVAGAERQLGRAVVALGSPAEQGLWLRTALVTSDTKGRVVTASGQSLAVDLRPGAGSAQLSLAAFQALGLGLTSLPEVTVFGP
ncbi:MAG: hypothetical protein V4712_07855 [Pseudomonadota bacterium]